MSASALGQRAIVVSSISKFFAEGKAFTSPSAGNASATAKPDITDTGWAQLAPIKWSKKPTHKTEVLVEGTPGGYVATDEYTVSKGLSYTGKFERQDNFTYQLQLCTAALAANGTAAGTYNPLAGSPVVKGWLHIQEYDGNSVLINTAQLWVSIKVTGETNNDDKRADTPIEATVLFSTLNVGDLK